MDPISKTNDRQDLPGAQKLCIFCYKATHLVDNYISVNKFITFLYRFLGKEITKKCDNEWPPFSWEKHDKLLSCCADCVMITNSFCDLYHQYKCIELWMFWKMERLVSVMKLASRVPSRMAQFRRLPELTGDERMPVNLKSFRRDIIRKCIARLSKSQPRVSLKRQNDSALAAHDLKPVICVKFNSSSTTSAAVETFLLGWFTSWAAVALLASELCGETYGLRRNDILCDQASLLDLYRFSEEEVDPFEMARNNETVTMQSAISDEEDNVEECEHEHPPVENSTVSICHLKKEEIVQSDNDSISSKQSYDDDEDETLPNQEESKSQYSDHEGEHILENRPHSPDNPLPILPQKSETNFQINSPTSVIVSPEGSTIKNFSCSLCPKAYKFRGTLKTHILNTHQNAKVMSLPFRCRFCHISFVSFKQLKHHNHESIKHQLRRKIFLERQRKARLNLVHPPVSHEPEELPPPSKPTQPKSVDNKQLEKAEITETQAKSRYNLREKRQRSIMNVELDEDTDMHSNSEYCVSDQESSESSTDSDCNTNRKSANEKSKKVRKVRVKIKRKSMQRKGRIYKRKNGNFVVCVFKGCKKFVRQSCLEEHQKLHMKGQFKCNFCDHVSKTPLELIKHEKIMHSPPSKIVSGKTILCCPRCDFNYQTFFSYRTHFANTHIWGLGITTSRRKAKDLIDKYPEAKQDIEDVIQEGSLKCKPCSRTFSSLANFLRHKRIYHTPDEGRLPESVKKVGNKYICPMVQCAESFRTVKKLEDHKKLHGSFKCNFCSMEKEYAPDLAFHEAEDHSIRDGDSTKKFNCSRCEFSFQKQSLYIRHHLETHLKLNSTTEICTICGAEGLSRVGKKHMKHYHKIDDLDPQHVHRCDQCSAYFRESRQLCYHKYKLHFNGKCPECGKGYPEWLLLVAHLDKKHPNHNHFPSLVLSCIYPGCRAKFATQVELEGHKNKKSHNEENEKLVCSDCGKEFKGALRLYMHRYNFHRESVHICPQCGKKFKSKLSLETHLEFHKSPDEWEFQCSTCERRFASKQKLEQHTRTHTKEKPFICQFCGEKYAHRHNWKNHLRTKHQSEFAKIEVDVKRKGDFLSRKGSKKGDCIMAGTKRS